MKPRLPYGAEQIWNLRLQKKKPNEIVFVSLIGEINTNYQVLLGSSQRIEELEWRWVRDLSVCVVYDDDTPVNRMTELTRHLVRLSPNGGYIGKHDPNFGFLWTWNAKKQNGYLLSWWKGFNGIPELEIDDQPETLEIHPISRLDRPCFEGVGA